MNNVAYIKPNLKEIAANLPASYATRWNPARKAAVVRAVEAGILPLERALTLYRLSLGEFATWQASYAVRGVQGLAAKRLAMRA